MSTPQIPGIPRSSQQALLAQLTGVSGLQAIWLFGSRAMERYQPGSDIDLCLDIASDQPLSHSDRLRLMAAIDDLLLPWTVDLALRQEIPLSSMPTCNGGAMPLAHGHHAARPAR